MAVLAPSTTSSKGEEKNGEKLTNVFAYISLIRTVPQSHSQPFTSLEQKLLACSASVQEGNKSQEGQGGEENCGFYLDSFGNNDAKEYECLFMLTVNTPHCYNHQMSYLVISAPQIILVK